MNIPRKKIIIIISFVVLVIYFALVSIRNKQENTHDVNLNLPVGTSDISLIETYTKECEPTILPKNQFPKDIVGISAVPPYHEKYYSLSKELGATWMRAEFDWRAIELPDGTYDWAATDTMVSDMNKNGFHLLGTISYIPTNLHTWEEIRNHFQKFTRALSQRYVPQGITYYEIFNEPNLPGWSWLDKKTKPEGYVGEYAILLAIANKEIHSTDSSAVVVIGGVSSDKVTGMPYPNFIKELLSYGSSKCFDVFAFHPYGHEGKFAQTVVEINSLFKQNGATPKPIWFNEYGTEQNQKLGYSIDSMFRERSAVDAWFWFTLRDLRPNNRWNYGLTDYDFKPKEAYFLFQSFLKKD